MVRVNREHFCRLCMSKEVEKTEKNPRRSMKKDSPYTWTMQMARVTEINHPKRRAYEKHVKTVHLQIFTKHTEHRKYVLDLIGIISFTCIVLMAQFSNLVQPARTFIFSCWPHSIQLQQAAKRTMTNTPTNGNYHFAFSCSTKNSEFSRLPVTMQFTTE